MKEDIISQPEELVVGELYQLVYVNRFVFLNKNPQSNCMIYLENLSSGSRTELSFYDITGKKKTLLFGFSKEGMWYLRKL